MTGNRERVEEARAAALRLCEEQEAINAQTKAEIAGRAPLEAHWERERLARGEGFASGLRVALAYLEGRALRSWQEG